MVIHAEIDAGCDRCGGPLFQMMCHYLVQNTGVDTNMVEYFIEKGAPLGRQIRTLEYDDQALKATIRWSALDLPLTVSGCSMSGIEVAKVLVKGDKIDCITGGAAGVNTYDVVPMFQEYWHHGTNYYIRWLCNEYVSNDKRRGFVDRVAKFIASMKQQTPKRWEYKRRTPSHAMLTCGHQKTIKLLLRKDSTLLSEKNSTGKTALHMAAEDGDLESVKILLEL